MRSAVMGRLRRWWKGLRLALAAQRLRRRRVQRLVGERRRE